MTSIPVAICRYSGNNFKRFYLKKKTHFVNFWLHFWNLPEIYNILKKKEEYPSLINSEIIATETDVCLSV